MNPRADKTWSRKFILKQRIFVSYSKTFFCLIVNNFFLRRKFTLNREFLYYKDESMREQDVDKTNVKKHSSL